MKARKKTVHSSGKKPKLSSGLKYSLRVQRDAANPYDLALVSRMTEGFALHEIICNERGEPCDYCFLDVNPAFERLTGLKRDEVIGKTVRQVLPGIEPVWINTYGKVALTGEPAHFQDYSAELGRHYDVHAYSPAPGRFAVLFVDNTEQVRREHELKKLNRMLTALSDSRRAMMHAREESSYLAEVCRIVQNDCGYAMIWIGYAEQDEYKSVRPVASAGFEEGYLDSLKITWADSERGHGPTGTAIRTGKVSLCRNMLTDPDFAPWRAEALKRGYAASIVLPLLHDGNAFGAVSIYAREADPFSAEEADLLSQLASDLAYGIMAIRFQAEHARAEEELRQSEARFRALIENGKQPVAILDEKFRFEAVSPSGAEVIGWKRGEILGRDFRQLITEHERHLAQKSLAPLQQDGSGAPVIFMAHCSREDGSTRWIEWEVVSILAADRVRGFLCTLRDLGTLGMK